MFGVSVAAAQPTRTDHLPLRSSPHRMTSAGKCLLLSCCRLQAALIYCSGFSATLGLYGTFVSIRKRCPFLWMGKTKGCPFGLMHSMNIQFNKWSEFLATRKAALAPGRFTQLGRLHAGWVPAATCLLLFCVWHTHTASSRGPAKPVRGADSAAATSMRRAACPRYSV